MWTVSDHLTFAVHGGGDKGEGLAGSVGNLLSFIEELVQLSPAEAFASLLPGIVGLPNIHPLFVHFPIALFALFLLSDVLGSLAKRPDWRQIASAFLYFGTVTAGITVAAGFVAADSVAHGGNVHEIMEQHEHLAISVLSLSVVLSIWRWLAKDVIVGPANALFLLAASILGALLTFTADLGGLMVYKYGVAVEAADVINQAAAKAHEHDADSPDTLAPVQQAAETDVSAKESGGDLEPATGTADHSHHHAH